MRHAAVDRAMDTTNNQFNDDADFELDAELETQSRVSPADSGAAHAPTGR